MSRGFRLLLCAALVAIGASGTVAGGTPRLAWATADDEGQENIDEAVAKALFEQGVRLYHGGQYADARALFLEAWERSPRGSYAASARQMVKRCDEKLGTSTTFPDPPSADDGGGGGGGSSGSDDGSQPVDPYGGDPVPDEGPRNPYEDDGDGGSDPNGPQNPYTDDLGTPVATADRDAITPTPISPYTDDLGDAIVSRDRGDTREVKTARQTLTIFGGVYGLSVAIGLLGAADSPSDGGVVLLTTASAGLGIGLAHHLVKRRHVTEGQSLAVMSGTTWGLTNALFLAKAVDDPIDDCQDCGDDQPENDYFAASVAGGAFGLAGGIWLASKKPTPGDVALTNSLASYGLFGGLLLGVAMDPRENRAYAINAFVGSAAGIVAGAVLSPKVEVSRRRMAYVDLGAGLGALSAWVLVYPAIEGDSADNQIVGALSLAFMGAGGYASWWLTRRMDHKARVVAWERPGVLPAPVPAVIARDSAGRWTFGMPLLHPFASPALAGEAHGLTLGVELVAGRW